MAGRHRKLRVRVVYESIVSRGKSSGLGRGSQVRANTGRGIQVFYAVNEKNLSFVDGIEIGRKIWNLDRAIWVMQGRHRDMEVLAGYVYNAPTKEPYYLPVYENDTWSYSPCVGRVLDRNRFEEWKTKYYDFKGWNSDSGWPKRRTLEAMGLKKVADTLQSKGRVG